MLLSGFLIGAAARYVVPGPDPMPFWLTVLVGLGGSVVGGGIGVALYGSSGVLGTPGHAFVSIMLEILAGAALVVLYRKFVQRRPLTGPDAYRFPTRGIGIARMRARLRQLGVDPDRLHSVPGAGQAPSDGSGPQPEEVTAELERLRERHERGEITDEEYEEARERLRRF